MDEANAKLHFTKKYYFVKKGWIGQHLMIRIDRTPSVAVTKEFVSSF
jgi:hypothetical protein